VSIKDRYKNLKGKPGPNANDAETSVCAIIANGVAVAGKLVLGTVYKINTPDALVELGITPAYDTTNKLLVHYQLSEFFRLANGGTTLYLMVVSQAILPQTILEDTANIYAKKLLVEANGEVYKMGISFNPEAAYAETLTDGFNSDIRVAIPKAHALRQWAQERNMPLDIVLEGRKFGGNSVTALDLRGIQISGEDVNYEGVALVIGQDWAVAEAKKAAHPLAEFHAAVGAFLGTFSSIKMEQDCGEVETLDITDADQLKFLVCGLSDHTKIKDVESKLDLLDDKGYIFPIKYVSITGHRWNGDHVCARIIIDVNGNQNEWKLAYSTVVNYTDRRLYEKLVPKIRTTHAVDTATGKLPLAKIKFFEALGDDVFNTMANAGHISGGETFVDPNSDLMRPPQTLKVNFEVVPLGTIGKILGTTSLKTKL
jgi:hypothetical protein